VFAGSGYRRLWSARTVSQWGDTVNFVALALLIYDLTGSGLGVSGVVVAEILPVLLIAPFAGPLVDRWPWVPVMVGSDLFRSVLAVVLAMWHDAPIGVYTVAFGMSVGAVFFNPAASSVLPVLVKKDALVAANSGIWTAAVLSQIVLAPLAGLLVVSLGYGPAFAINAVSYASSAVLLRGLRVPGRPEKASDAGCLPRPVKGSPFSCTIGFCVPSRSDSSSPRSQRAQPVPCWWSSPKNTSVSADAATGSSSQRSGSVRPSARSSCSGSSATRPAHCSCSAPTDSEASSTSPSPRSPQCRSPQARWPSTVSAPPPVPSRSTPCFKP